jgi:HAD superfamily hydrolase (TIGR01509 family)
MNFQAIIFDLDGVVVNSEELFQQKEGQFYGELIGNFDSEDQENILGTSIYDTWQYLTNKHGLKLDFRELRSRYIDYCLEHIYPEVKPLKGVAGLIQTIYKHQLPLAIASSSPHPLVNAALRQVGLENYFKVIISADDLDGIGKPDPGVYLLAAKKLGKNPENCLVFEDSKNGVIAGKRAKMTVWAIQTKINQKIDLTAADQIFNSFTELDFSQISGQN